MKQNKAQLWYKPLLLVLCALFVVTIGLSTATTTYAARGGADTWVDVGEIYNDDGDAFNATELNKLYRYLTQEGTFDAVKTAATDGKTSNDFRTLNGGKNITVTFGGKKWDVVYLTTAKNGDVILDLWRSADTLTDTDKAQFAPWSNNPTPADTYPSAMYSTSMIRVVTLNAGGKYSTAGAVLSELQQQSKDNQYARFTMSSVDNSLTKYIAKPSEVGYQAKEYSDNISRDNSKEANKGFYHPNSSYEYVVNKELNTNAEWNTSVSTQDGTQCRYNYGTTEKDSTREEGAKYGSWKDDYLWLPSIEETGREESSTAARTGIGIWHTDESLRSATGSAWTRSGHTGKADVAIALSNKGIYTNNTNATVTKNNYVRPALHLNLTAASKAVALSKADWKDESQPYDPQGVKWVVNADNVTIEAVPLEGDTSWWDGATHTITANKVGTYQLKVTPTGGLQWDDKTSDPITVKYTVTKGEITVTWEAAESYTYTGAVQEKPTATAKDLPEGLTIKVAEQSGKEFKDAGTYTFEATLTGTDADNYTIKTGTNTKECTIGAVAIAVEWEDKTFPYTGETYGYPTATAKGLGEDVLTVTVTMKGEAKDFKDAGTYTFTAVLEGTTKDNYTITEGTAEKEYYIGKKSVTAPSSFDSKTYNGEEQTVVVESSEYQLKEGSGKGTTVGKYDVVLQLKDADNYKWSDSDLSEKTLSQAFEITQAAIAVTWSGADFSYKYTYGSVTTPTATAKGFGSDVLTVKVSESSGKEFKNVGEYTFTAALEGTAKDNYTVSNPTQAYTIERASLNAALSASVVYGESISAKDVTVTISDGLQNGDDKATIEEQAKAKVEAFSFSYTAGKTHVGDEATVSAEQVQLDNYTVTFTQGKITVNQRKIKLTLEGARSNTYGDEAHGVITASAKLSEGEGNWYGSDADIEELNKQLDYKFKKDGAGAASAYVPTMGAGNYTISVEWKEGSSLAKDYELVGEPQDASYTVNKAILTVTANEHAVTYGEAPSGDSGVTFSGFKNDENVDVVSGKAVYSYDYVQYQDIDGSYHITPAKGTLNADNYDFAFVAGALKVNAKQLTVKIVLPSKLSYNDISDFTAQLTGVVNSDDVAVKLVYNGTPNDKSSFSNSAAKPTLAGEYTVKATGLEGTKAKNYTLSGDGEQSFTVKRAAVTKPTQNASTFTYNGQDQTYTVVGGDAKLFTVRDNVKKDANESGYTVTVSLNDKNNYMWAESDESTDELTFIFKIMKKELAVQWTGENHVYDGNVFGDPSAKAETEITGEAPFELDVRMTSPLGGTFQSKGEYTFTASFKGTDSDRSKNYSLKEDTLTQTYTISQGTNSWMTPLALEGWIYDGTSHEPSAQAKFGEAVFTYAVSEQGNYSDVKPKDAGTYWVKATVKGTADYAELTATLQFTITQRQIDAVWMTGSYVYSGVSLELPTATATGIGDDGEFTLMVSPSFTGDFKNVGDYTFAAEFDTSDAKTNNYTLTTDTVTHTYTVAKQRVSVPEIADKVYSGAVQKADVLTSALYTVTENNGGTNVGNYDVKLTLSDSANYAWQGSEGAEITLTFKIIKATYDMSGVSFEDVTLIEDGTSKSIAASGQLPEGVSVTYENNNQSKCGVYEVVASFSGDYVNYNQIPDMTATLTLLRTALSVETSEVPGADDEQSGPIVSVESEKGIDPSVELVVECKDAPSEESANVLESGNSLELLERVGAVYDISLYSDGVEVQPNGEIKIKIRIPLNLQGEQFRLLHIHGDQATEVDYQIEDGYVVFTTESLSEFVFAYKVSLWWLWPLLALVVVAAVVTTIVVVHKQRKKH